MMKEEAEKNNNLKTENGIKQIDFIGRKLVAQCARKHDKVPSRMLQWRKCDEVR